MSFAFEFSIEDWKDVPQGLKPPSARVLWHGEAVPFVHQHNSKTGCQLDSTR